MEKFNKCIFCLRSDRSFTKKAHIIPESASNKNLILPKGFECDSCNQDFSKFEQQVLRSIPGFSRVANIQKTKRGKSPTADFKGGKIKCKNANTIDRPTVQIIQYAQNPNSIKPIIQRDKSIFTWDGPNLSARKLCALLAKISIEFLCLNKNNVYDSSYNTLRSYALTMKDNYFYPFFVGFHFSDIEEISIISEFDNSLRPIWIRFPGISAIIPTRNKNITSKINELKEYIENKMDGQYLLITDPSWEKPIRVNLNLFPVSEIAQRGQNKLFEQTYKT